MVPCSASANGHAISRLSEPACFAGKRSRAALTPLGRGASGAQRKALPRLHGCVLAANLGEFKTFFDTHGSERQRASKRTSHPAPGGSREMSRDEATKIQEYFDIRYSIFCLRVSSSPPLHVSLSPNLLYPIFVSLIEMSPSIWRINSPGFLQNLLDFGS